MDGEIETENNVHYNSVQIKVEPNIYDVSTTDTCPGTELSEKCPDIRTSDILPVQCFKSDIKSSETVKNINDVEIQMNQERNIDDITCPYSRDVTEGEGQSSDQQNSNKGHLRTHERPSRLLSNDTTYAVNIKYEPSSWDGNEISHKNGSISSSIPYTQINDNRIEGKSHSYKNYIEASDETLNQDVQLSCGPIKYYSNESNNYTHEKNTEQSVPYHDHDHTYSTCYKELYSSNKRIRIYEHIFKDQKQCRYKGEKSYPGSMRSYSSTTSDALAEHTIKHTREKLYKCDGCSYSTVNSGALGSHKRKHTDSYVNRCKTTTSDDLAKHRIKHTGEQRYSQTCLSDHLYIKSTCILKVTMIHISKCNDIHVN